MPENRIQSSVASKCYVKHRQQQPKDECGDPIPRDNAKAYSTGPIRPSQVCKYALCSVKPLSVTFCNAKNCGTH